jgi:hypothetical protein
MILVVIYERGTRPACRPDDAVEPETSETTLIPISERHRSVTFRRLCIPGKVSSSEAIAYFEDYAYWFERWLAADSVRAVVVSDLAASELNPLGHEGSWGIVVSMLILAYPEISWGFAGSVGASDLSRTPAPAILLSPLFDISGVRDFVRQQAREDVGTGYDAGYLPRRTRRALSLDEESGYGLVHAYTAYRFGYRAVVADRWTIADNLLRNSKSKWDVVFEDIYLSFPDGISGLSKLYHRESESETQGRADWWSTLERAEHRIFITAGRHDDASKWTKNHEYITSQSASQHIEVLHKPHAGMFKLWRESRLGQRLAQAKRSVPPPILSDADANRGNDNSAKASHCFGTAPEFEWPPASLDPHIPPSSPDADHAPIASHSSPGRLMLVASHLIRRATRLFDSTRTVEQAIRGAVLATDALEILGGRTPTLAVEALRLKHRFEVKAECLFAGVEHHLNIHDRLIEIRRDVAYISEWFGESQVESAALNAEMQTLLDLVVILRENNLFDEEEACLQRTREIQRMLWRPEVTSRFKTVQQWVVPKAWRYVNWLIGSPYRFIQSLILILTWGCLLLIALDFDRRNIAFVDAFNALLTFNVTEDHAGVLYDGVLDALVILGIFHLGIFISRLYTWISRK